MVAPIALLAPIPLLKIPKSRRVFNSHKAVLISRATNLEGHAECKTKTVFSKIY